MNQMVDIIRVKAIEILEFYRPAASKLWWIPVILIIVIVVVTAMDVNDAMNKKWDDRPFRK